MVYANVVSMCCRVACSAYYLFRLFPSLEVRETLLSLGQFSTFGLVWVGLAVIRGWVGNLVFVGIGGCVFCLHFLYLYQSSSAMLQYLKKDK